MARKLWGIGMKEYEELECLFGESEQAYLVTTLPFSKEARILYGNIAAIRLLEETCKNILGKHVGELCWEWNDERKLYHSIFDKDMCLCLLVGMDHSSVDHDRRKIEQDLEAANVASRAKTKFLSEMSHDIRTPMNAIMGMTDIALSHVGDRQRVEDCLKKIQMASGHLLSLINEVLDMSRIESGRMTLVEEVIQLADMIHEILIVIKPQAVKKNISFHLELRDIFQEDLVGDLLRIRQIYINLLSNAVKYTESGGNVWMRLRQRKGEKNKVWLELEVEDNGIGMTQEFLERIFEPFERERNTTFSKIEGTGLGMSITKKLVEMMEGTIDVESSKGTGSKFTVRIPLEMSQEVSTWSKAAFAGKRILVIQGAEEKLEKLPSMLENLGMETDVASCGSDAVDLLNEADICGIEYFALLTNDKLEDLEISLLLPQICARKGKDFPILLLSESDWSEVEYLLKQSGVTAFVPLPLFESRLAQALFPYTQEGKQSLEAETQKGIVSFEGSHIMLVEDNELNREIAVEILSTTGADIETACNGQEAVDLFKEREPFYFNLILMDIQMPVMDGLEATRQIRAFEREDSCVVHIVAMSANAFVEDKQRSIEAGMNAHVSKPLDVQQLLDCLEQWCSKVG